MIANYIVGKTMKKYEFKLNPIIIPLPLPSDAISGLCYALKYLYADKERSKEDDLFTWEDYEKE